MVYQRNVDAELDKEGPEDTLASRYGKPTYAWVWWLVGAFLLATLLIGALFALLRSLTRSVKGTRFRIPEVVTPFTVLGLLRDIEHNNGFAAAQKQELATSIQQLERHYFAGMCGNEPDLKKIAETWVARAT
jgi:hypothetical protein